MLLNLRWNVIKYISLFLFVVSMYLPASTLDWIKEKIPKAELSGSATFRYFFLKIYDSTLYAPLGKWEESKPFALSLEYNRSFEGQDIAKRSIREIQGVGFLNKEKLKLWRIEMEQVFPDVKKGSVIIGVYNPNKATYFYQKDGKELGVINDPEFGLWFFRIWLSEKTSEPKMRRKLLNLK